MTIYDVFWIVVGVLIIGTVSAIAAGLSGLPHWACFAVLIVGTIVFILF